MSRPVSEFTGEQLDPRGEQYRNECECRFVLAMPTREARNAFVDGLFEAGKLVRKGVRQHRGDAAANRLKDDVRRLWELRKARAAATQEEAA